MLTPNSCSLGAPPTYELEADVSWIAYVSEHRPKSDMLTRHNMELNWLLPLTIGQHRIVCQKLLPDLG
jgi:hypothetical protein